MEETACTLWEKAWGMWARAPILLHPPLKGLELLFSFCQRWKGKEEEEHLPHHPHRHTDTRSPIPHPQRLHRLLDNTTFKDKQPLPSPTTTLPASSQRQQHPGTVGAPAPPPLTHSSLQARGSGQGERRRKGGSEGRGRAKGRRRELRTAIRTTTSRR